MLSPLCSLVKVCSLPPPLQCWPWDAPETAEKSWGELQAAGCPQPRAPCSHWRNATPPPQASCGTAPTHCRWTGGFVVSIGPSVCQQKGITLITSIRMQTRRNAISAGTWGQGLLGCQDSPQKPHEPEGPLWGHPCCSWSYSSCTAGYEGRGKHLCCRGNIWACWEETFPCCSSVDTMGLLALLRGWRPQVQLLTALQAPTYMFFLLSIAWTINTVHLPSHVLRASAVSAVSGHRN